MGTCADFYIGKGKDAEWIGSVAYDGYCWDPDVGKEEDTLFLVANSEQEFRSNVSQILKGRKDATTPDQGWPWPWKDSNNTDYAYCYVDGDIDIFKYEDDIEWPEMDTSRAAIEGDDRSGIMMSAITLIR